MKTIYAVVMLLTFGGVAKMLTPFILTVVSLPGRFIAFPNATSTFTKPRFILGTIIATILQSYVYLAYTAFIINWTMLAIQKQRVSFIVLPLTFLATILPVWFAFKDFRLNVKEMDLLNKEKLGEFSRHEAEKSKSMFNILAQASLITFLLTLLGFFVFSSAPEIMDIIYGWVPFV